MKSILSHFYACQTLADHFDLDAFSLRQWGDDFYVHTNTRELVPYDDKNSNFNDMSKFRKRQGRTEVGKRIEFQGSTSPDPPPLRLQQPVDWTQIDEQIPQISARYSKHTRSAHRDFHRVILAASDKQLATVKRLYKVVGGSVRLGEFAMIALGSPTQIINYLTASYRADLLELADDGGSHVISKIFKCK
jgi:hypothetical protein